MHCTGWSRARDRRPRSPRPEWPVPPQRPARAPSRRAPPKETVSSLELSPYVEAEQFGVVAFLLHQRLGEVEPDRSERRHPVEANADGEARLRLIAEIELRNARR